MTKVVDYDYIQEISAEDALKNSASDVTSWYNWNVPGVNTFKINAETSIYNEQWWGSWIAGWSTNVSWTATDYNTVSWGSWDINLPDWTTLTVTSGNTGNMSATTYIYYDREDDTVKYTTTSADSVWENKILLCVAAPTVSWKDAEFQAFGTNAQSTFIHADQIAANTITGNEVQANSITSNELSVSQLSAISANLWLITAGTVSWTTITAWSTSSGAVKLYPYSSTQWRIDFYAGGSIVWYIYGRNVPSVGDTVFLNASTATVLDWDVYILNRDRLDLSQAKLRIPVWTNLY